MAELIAISALGGCQHRAGHYGLPVHIRKRTNPMRSVLALGLLGIEANLAEGLLSVSVVNNLRHCRNIIV
jgi:hypothetical protein